MTPKEPGTTPYAARHCLKSFAATELKGSDSTWHPGVTGSDRA